MELRNVDWTHFTHLFNWTKRLFEWIDDLKEVIYYFVGVNTSQGATKKQN